MLQLRLNAVPGLLTIHVVSDDLPAHMGEVASGVIDAMRTVRPARVLIDQREALGRLSPGAFFMHVGGLPLTAAPAARVAVLEPPMYAEHAAFAEDALFNRGFTNVRYFTEEAAALAWLWAGPGGGGPPARESVVEGADAG